MPGVAQARCRSAEEWGGAASARGVIEFSGPPAHAGLGEGELIACGCVLIPGEVGGHATHLLIAGECEEGRCATVGLRADDIEIRLGLGELAGTGRGDGTAGVDVRVDLGSDACDRLERAVEVGPELSQNPGVRPEARQCEHPPDSRHLASVFSDDRQAGIGLTDLGNTESGHEFHHTVVDHGACAGAECGAFGQFVSWTATEDVRGAPSAQQPGHAGSGRPAGKFAQAQHGMRGGMSRSDDDDVRTRELRDIGWDAVRDQVRRLGLADRRVAVGTRRVGKAPGAARIDDRTGEESGFAARGIDRVHDERLAPAACVDDLVAPLAGDPRDGRGVVDPLAQSVGERRQVVAHPLRTGRVSGGRCAPPGRLEQATGRSVGEFGPRREQAHVTPFRDGGCRTTPALHDDDLLATLDEMRRCGEALRPCSDDDDGKLRHQHSSDRKSSI